jgi:hypothetical protein
MKGWLAALLMIPLVACNDDGDAARLGAPNPFQDETLSDGSIAITRGRGDRNCDVTFLDLLRNYSDVPVTITGARFEPTTKEHDTTADDGTTKTVTLGTMVGVTVLGFRSIPPDSPKVANPPGYPPRPLRKVWPDTEDLVGSTIAPGEEVWFVFGLRLDPKLEEGSVADLIIDYEREEVAGQTADNDAFIVVPPKDTSSCTTSSE